MIEVKNVKKKSFPDKMVLKGIDATFHNGKTNLIIGQSGREDRADEEHHRTVDA